MKIDSNIITSPVALYHLTQVMQTSENVLISGATRSGKTVLLQELAKLTEEQGLTAVIEDYPNLDIPEPIIQKTRLESENRATLGDLIQQVKKMRVNRIILDELRGDEAQDYLQAANTGTKTLTTISATDPHIAMERLINLASWNASHDAATALAYMGINTLVHISRDPSQRHPQKPTHPSVRMINMYNVIPNKRTTIQSNGQRMNLPGILEPIYIDPRTLL